MKSNLKAKVKAIIDQIDKLFGDRSVMQEDTREALEEIRIDIDAKLNALTEDESEDD